MQLKWRLRRSRLVGPRPRKKIARMTLTIKLDRNWSSFQLAINTPPLSVTGSVIAPSARMLHLQIWNYERKLQLTTLTLNYHGILCKVEWERKRLSCGSVYSGSLPHSALAQVPSTTSSAWFCLLCRQPMPVPKSFNCQDSTAYAVESLLPTCLARLHPSTQYRSNFAIYFHFTTTFQKVTKDIHPPTLSSSSAHRGNTGCDIQISAKFETPHL